VGLAFVVIQGNG